MTGCALFGPDPAFEATLPAAVEPDTKAIAVVGDLQMSPAVVRRLRGGREFNGDPQRTLMDDMYAHIDGLGALVIVGDLVFTGGSTRDWQHFDDLVAPFATRIPVLPAIGNHDYHCLLVNLCWHSAIPARFLERFPWFEPGIPYEVAYGDLILIFLDSETAIAEQAAWLAQRLAAHVDRYEAALIFFHRPPYSNSIDRGADGNPEIASLVVPVLEAVSLPIVIINGHVHGYEHFLVDEIHYFTTAGGGGPRGLLGADRPGDVYRGRDCITNEDGSVLRPFNYALISPGDEVLTIEVRGFCRGDTEVALLESVRVPYAR